MTRNVWITTTFGNYEPIKIKNSILSFRRFNQEAHIASIVDGQSYPLLKDFFEQHRIEPIHLSGFKNINFEMNWRHSLYMRWLFANPQYEHILLCDTRDVVFQGNYFENLPYKYVFLFQEDTGVTIDSEPNNSYWTRAIFGDHVMSLIGKGNIVCCGTIAGSRLEFLELLNYISTETFRLPPDQINGFVVDQALTNYGYLTGAFKHMPIIKKLNGDIVGTLHCTIRCDHSTDKFYLDVEQQAIIVNGKKPSIIHQYDRREDLQQFFDNLYPLSS